MTSPDRRLVKQFHPKPPKCWKNDVAVYPWRIFTILIKVLFALPKFDWPHKCSLRRKRWRRGEGRDISKYTKMYLRAATKNFPPQHFRNIWILHLHTRTVHAFAGFGCEMDNCLLHLFTITWRFAQMTGNWTTSLYTIFLSIHVLVARWNDVKMSLNLKMFRMDRLIFSPYLPVNWNSKFTSLQTSNFLSFVLS